MDDFSLKRLDLGSEPRQSFRGRDPLPVERPEFISEGRTLVQQRILSLAEFQRRTIREKLLVGLYLNLPAKILAKEDRRRNVKAGDIHIVLAREDFDSAMSLGIVPYREGKSGRVGGRTGSGREGSR
jgi:hypothetical protein